MSRQFWQEPLSWATADGTAIANTTAETIIMPNITIPANYMQDGRRLLIRLMGKYSTTGTPTLTFRLRWGGVSGTVLAASGAMTTGSAVTNGIFSIDLSVQVRTNGATGTMLCLGSARLGEDASSTVGSATNAGAEDFMGSAGVAAPSTATVDLTVDTALAISAQWGTASASNTLTGMDYHILSVN
jgi:hypothetical protein